jgi:LysR family glycine cleavage system transcriptional activator
MDRIPPLSSLRAFDFAGRHLNFRSAANEMGVTQVAVAQQVRQGSGKKVGVRTFR